MIPLEAKTTALVLIDLQKGIVASHSTELHAFAMENIFPRLSRVVASADLTFAAAP